MIRVGICDDDKIFGQELEGCLLEYAKRKNLPIEVHVFIHAKELLQNIEEEEISMLFLEIELPE